MYFKSMVTQMNFTKIYSNDNSSDAFEKERLLFNKENIQA